MISKNQERYRNIGLNIAKFRKERGLTQEKLANMVGISYSYITKIEAKNTLQSFSLEVLFDIADILGVDVKELL